MDYEKKYNEALSKCKAYIDDTEKRWSEEFSRATEGVFKEIFPELRESEDERARKAALEGIEYLERKLGWDAIGDTDILDVKEYLEKQKEHTPADGWDYADKRMSHPLYWEGFEAGRAVERELSEFEKQKEQKPAEWNDTDMKEARDNLISVCRDWERGKQTTLLPIAAVRARFFLEHLTEPKEWSEDIIRKSVEEVGLTQHQIDWFKTNVFPPPKQEWSEDYREEDIQTRFAFYTYKDDPSVLYLSNVFVEETSRNHGFGTRILKAAEKAAEAIGAITICLKVKQDSPANVWYRKRGYGYVAFEDGYDWLEKNLEYLKPTKSAEWNEEDERMVKFYEDDYDNNLGNMPMRDVIENRIKFKDWILNRLKSLRPQPHWKPCEEQMEALMLAIEGKCPPTSYMSRRLEDLYEQLKKL